VFRPRLPTRRSYNNLVPPMPGNWKAGDAVAANAATGYLRGIGNLAGAPHSIASLAGHIGVPGADFVARHTYSPGEINQGIFTGGAQPYEPETLPGKIGQSALSNIIPSVFSGGPVGVGARIATGMAAGAGGQAVANVAPDNYWAQLAASLPQRWGPVVYWVVRGRSPGLLPPHGTPSRQSVVRLPHHRLHPHGPADRWSPARPLLLLPHPA